MFINCGLQKKFRELKLTPGIFQTITQKTQKYIELNLSKLIPNLFSR